MTAASFEVGSRMQLEWYRLNHNSSQSGVVKNALILVFALLTVFAKLALVGSDEILAIPDDSVNYAHQALHSLGKVGAPSGYPIWLALSVKSGLPQRIAIEILYLAGAACLSHAVGRVTAGLTGLALFLALAFVPTSYFLFDHALSDGFYGCLGLFALGLSIGILTNSHSWTSVLVRATGIGVLFGWMLITRAEAPIIGAWIVSLVAVHAALHWQTPSRRKWFAKEMVLCAWLVMLACAGPLARSTYAEMQEGVFATSVATLPSHLGLLQRLAGIDVGVQSPERVPVSRAQRAAAYLVSPLLAELGPQIEDSNNMYQHASHMAGFAEGEVGGGWAWHLFNDAAINNLKQRDLASLDLYWRNVNGQLDAAFGDGRLKRRWVIAPLLGSNLGALARRLPASVEKAYGLMFSGLSDSTDLGYEANLFDTAFLRRTSLVAASVSTASFSGWAFVGGHNATVKLVELTSRSPAGVDQTDILPLLVREDVIRDFHLNTQSSGVYGFRFRGPVSAQDPAFRLRYTLSDGTVLSTKSLSESAVTVLNSDHPDELVTQGIDEATIRLPILPGRDLQIELYELFRQWMPRLAPLLLLFVLTCAMTRRRTVPLNSAEKRLLALILFLSALAFERVVFYAIVDAGAWNIEDRYMFMATLMAIGAMILSSHLVLIRTAALARITGTSLRRRSLQ